jgi:SAM-dependent methyltransferase
VAASPILVSSAVEPTRSQKTIVTVVLRRTDRAYAAVDFSAQVRSAGTICAMTTWGAGEYRLMAERLRPVAAAAIQAAAVTASDRVVDVATGTGNAALFASESGAEVVGVDFEPALLDIAKSRAAESGARVRWEVADVTALPVADAWASVVVSVFGVMYAADHDAAAGELTRCVARDGRIVLASWIPGSFMPALGQALGAFLPPPPTGSGPPSRWGDASALDELFGPSGFHVAAHSTNTLTMAFDRATDATDFLIRTAGNVIAERDRLTEEGRWSELQVAVRQLVDDRSRASDDQCHIDFDYLLATVRAR